MAAESSSQNTPWFAVSIGLMGLILGYSIASFSGASFGIKGGQQVAQVPSVPSVPDGGAAASAAPVALIPEVTKDDHQRGAANPKVTVVEYTDHECPFCARNYPTQKAVLAAYPNDVSEVIRHFPLDFHANAEKEAEATECAADLGGNDAFWKYSDAIFERTTSNGTGFALDKLVPLAKEIGLNEAKFKDCLDTGKFAEKVANERSIGQNAGINGTPGLVLINNATKEQVRLPGAVPQSEYDKVIKQFLGA